MKKSVMLMVGILAVALAGSAQAATTMFAVQNASAVDQMVVQDNGWIGVGTNAPISPVHVVGSALDQAAAGFIYNFTNIGTINALTAPNFSFMRNNDPLQVFPGTANAGLPRALDMLGVVNFGTVVGGANRNMVVMQVRAEADATTTQRPGYITFNTFHNSGATGSLTEKFRISSLGNVIIPAVTTNTGGGSLGIGISSTTAPTSKLQVVGLPVYDTNQAALTAGLTAGAFYRCGPAAVSPASQSLCVVY